jgi:hypothetical protein
MVEASQLLADGDVEGAERIAKEAQTLAARQKDLANQIDPRYAASLLVRATEQSAKVLEVLAQIEEKKAEIAKTQGRELEVSIAVAEERALALQQILEEIDAKTFKDKYLKIITEIDDSKEAAKIALEKAQAAGGELERGGELTFEMRMQLKENLGELLQDIDAQKAQIEEAAPEVKIVSFVDATLVLPGVEEAAAIGQAAANANPITIPTLIGEPSSWWDAAGNPLPIETAAYASGGAVKPPNGVDNLLGWFNADEFVLRAQATRYYGRGFLDRLNNMMIPKYAAGGPVTSPVNVYVGGSGYPMRADPSVAEDLSRALRLEVLRRGRR